MNLKMELSYYNFVLVIIMGLSLIVAIEISILRLGFFSLYDAGLMMLIYFHFTNRYVSKDQYLVIADSKKNNELNSPIKVLR